MRTIIVHHLKYTGEHYIAVLLTLNAYQETHLALFSLRTDSDNPDATCELSP